MDGTARQATVLWDIQCMSIGHPWDTWKLPDQFLWGVHCMLRNIDVCSLDFYGTHGMEELIYQL